eukprot:1066810_1
MSHQLKSKVNNLTFCGPKDDVIGRIVNMLVIGLCRCNGDVPMDIAEPIQLYCGTDMELVLRSSFCFKHLHSFDCITAKYTKFWLELKLKERVSKKELMDRGIWYQNAKQKAMAASIWKIDYIPCVYEWYDTGGYDILQKNTKVTKITSKEIHALKLVLVYGYVNTYGGIAVPDVAIRLIFDIYSSLKYCLRQWRYDRPTITDLLEKGIVPKQYASIMCMNDGFSQLPY